MSASIHASSSLVVWVWDLGQIQAASIRARTPSKRSSNPSIHAPSQHESIVNLNPERRVRRVIDHQLERECDLFMLVSGGPFSSVPPPECFLSPSWFPLAQQTFDMDLHKLCDCH